MGKDNFLSAKIPSLEKRETYLTPFWWNMLEKARKGSGLNGCLWKARWNLSSKTEAEVTRAKNEKQMQIYELLF